MTYKHTSSLALTRNTLILSASDAVEAISYLQYKITHVNGKVSLCDLATGEVDFKSARKSRKINNENSDSYVLTPVYFKDPNPTITESLYRKARVHVLNTGLSEYHRGLYLAALQRAVQQDNVDLSAAKAHIHHLDRNKRNNSLYNLLPLTNKEHNRLHKLLRRGFSDYEALVKVLGADLVHDIFGVDYFDFGDGGGVHTASIQGVPYAQHMLTQLSAANLPTNTKYVQVQLTSGRYSEIAISNNIYKVLSDLYKTGAIKIIY